MKKLLYLFVLILVLMAVPAMAQNYAADFDQNGSFETEYTLNPGNTAFNVDIHLKDLPEAIIGDAVWITYDHSAVEITAIGVYDDGSGKAMGGTGPVPRFSSLGGCWDGEMTAAAWQDTDGDPNTTEFLVATGTMGMCPASGNDDKFLSITFKCVGAGDAHITLEDKTFQVTGVVTIPLPVLNDPLNLTIHQAGGSTNTTTTTSTQTTISSSSIISSSTTSSTGPSPFPSSTTSSTGPSPFPSSTTSSVSSLWPMAYDKMWNTRKDKNLLITRAFRDEILLNTKAGRTLVFVLYDNSIEIVTLLLQDPYLTAKTTAVIDELLMSVQSLLYHEKLEIKQNTLDKVLSLLNQFEIKASPELRAVIEKVRRNIESKYIFGQLGIIICK